MLCKNAYDDSPAHLNSQHTHMFIYIHSCLFIHISTQEVTDFRNQINELRARLSRAESKEPPLQLEATQLRAEVASKDQMIKQMDEELKHVLEVGVHTRETWILGRYASSSDILEHGTYEFALETWPLPFSPHTVVHGREIILN